VAAADRLDVLAAVRSAYPVDGGDFPGCRKSRCRIGHAQNLVSPFSMRLDGHSARLMAETNEQLTVTAVQPRVDAVVTRSPVAPSPNARRISHG
jgi:hypothetical protein